MKRKISRRHFLKKSTALPAQKFGFKKRGVLKAGYLADLVVFNKDKILDKATWSHPHQYPQGIEYVVVNGQIVINQGEHTGNLPGRILRKQVTT